MQLPTNYNDLSRLERKEVREEYCRRQNGLCRFCRAPLDKEPDRQASLAFEVNKDLFPKGFFNYPVHLHHSHEDGMTLGAVHCYCNAVLWQYYGE